jgi:hypothetical protein
LLLSGSPITPKARKSRTRLQEIKGTPPTPDLFPPDGQPDDPKTPDGRSTTAASSMSPQDFSPLPFSQSECRVIWRHGQLDPLGRSLSRQQGKPGESPITSKTNKNDRPKGFEKFRLGLKDLIDEDRPANTTTDSMDFNGSSDEETNRTKSLPNIDKVCMNLNNQSFVDIPPTTETDSSMAMRKVFYPG